MPKNEANVTGPYQDTVDKEVNRILTQKVVEFHEGLSTPVVLFLAQDIAVWLTERHPLQWQLLVSGSRSSTMEMQ